MMISVFDKVKKQDVGKGEIVACYQHFLLCPQCFPRVFSLSI